MKITRRQLRRIITEAARGSMVNEGSTETEIENSIMRTLADQPGIGGMELAQRVMSEVPGVDRDSVFSFLDVLLEDGVVYFNEEEDEWTLR
jgi:hypothetical protein